MIDLFSLSGRRALVTGASRGLGRRFAATLADAGAAVALAARRAESCREAVAEIEARGARAIAVVLDVADAESVRSGVAAAAEALGGGIDLLVNNAGVTATARFLEQEEAEWDRILDTNLKGAWRVAREVARRMADSGGGNIINVASILGLRVAGGVAAYAASKAALIQLTRAMALELARHNIRVNALAPGYIETDLNREFFASEAGQALIRRVPQRRLGRPEDLDGPLLLLASDAASRYMTGSVLVVDGGHTLAGL